MRLLTALLFATLAFAGQDDQIRDHRNAARKALNAKNYAVYRDHIVALRTLTNGQAETTYSLAAADALLGHSKEAIKELNEFAETGLSHDVAADARFASLKNLPEFQTAVKRLAENKRPISHSRVVFTLPDPDLIAEDIAYDAASKTFFISSVHQRKIVAVDSEGSVTDFVPEAKDGIWAVFALAIDSKRGVLWATTAAVAEANGFRKEDAGKTALLRYDLRTAQLLRRYDLPPDGSPHALGDMTVGPDGTVYVSDGFGRVYRLAPNANALVAISKPGDFRSPQTPALSPDGKKLFVADYSLGVGVIDLKTGRVSWPPRSKPIALEGTDGLYLDGHGLIAVQNGVAPARLIRAQWNADYTALESAVVLERASPSLGDPTHGVIVGRTFYFIGNSGWDRMSDSGSLTPGAPRDRSVILQLNLDGPHS